LDIVRLTVSNLKSALKDAGLSSKVTYGENQLRPVLGTFLKTVEQLVLEVCKPFDSFGLLCALQHHLPFTIMNPPAGFEGDAQVQFNNVATLAFRFCSPTTHAKVKFTQADYKKMAETNDRSLLDDYSDVVQQIYYIVDIIDLSLKRLRWLGKGATATVNLKGDDISTVITMQIPIELQQKMHEYDERLIHNQDILIKQAIPLGVVNPESPLKCVVVNPNWDEFRKGNFSPPPIPKVFGMDAIYTFTSFHANEVIQLFGKRVHVEDLFVLIATLFKPLVEDALNNKRFAGQGYSYVEEEHLIEYVMTWAPTIYSDCFNQKAFNNGTPFVLESLYSGYWKEVAPRILRFISHDFATRDSIDYLLFRPTKFAYRCDNGIVFLHLGTVLHFFMYLLDRFEKTGEVGEIKGRVFERLLLGIIESIKGFKRIWEPSHKLKFAVAGRTGTDVDVFVQKNNLAFLISCKSYGVSRKYELGDGQIWWDRSESAKSWLSFAQKTAKVVAKYHRELKIPTKIVGILPFVCTGWPEYLFEPSQDYFMEDGTPRIATLGEIEQFCKSINKSKCKALLSDPWIVHIPS